MDAELPFNQLLSLVGARLVGISRGDLCIDGELNTDDLGPFELLFDNGCSLQARLADDGESVEMTLCAGVPAELIGQGGPWPRIDLGHSDQYAPFIGSSLTAVRYLCFGTHSGEIAEVLAGVELSFDSGSWLIYYNAGDFAKIYACEHPPPLPEPFYLRLSVVPPGT